MEIKILLIDDHPAVLAGLCALLVKQREMSVAASFTAGHEALTYLSGENPVDIIFLDINLPEINGYELCRIISKKFPAIKIIALSTFYERSNIIRMIQNGASGYLPKTADIDEMLNAIATVRQNELYLGKDIKSELLNAGNKNATQEIPKLTRREKEILAAIAEGKTNPQIAEQLFLSTLTIETHRKNIMHKLNVSNTATLIKAAIENGLV